MEDFKSPADRARLLIWVLIGVVLVATLSFVSEVYAITTIDHFQAGSATLDDLRRVDQYREVAALFEVTAMLISGLATFFWLYRVNKNAHAWDAVGWMTVSPGWNIGYFFVPLANLLMPFRGLAQTLQVSTRPDEPEAVPVPLTMRLWWGALLISSTLGNLSLRMAMNARSLDQVENVAWLNACNYPIDLVAIFCFAWLVRTITREQRAEPPVIDGAAPALFEAAQLPA